VCAAVYTPEKRKKIKEEEEEALRFSNVMSTRWRLPCRPRVSIDELPDHFGYLFLPPFYSSMPGPSFSPSSFFFQGPHPRSFGSNCIFFQRGVSTTIGNKTVKNAAMTVIEKLDHQ
jgi:hypothetical protein